VILAVAGVRLARAPGIGRRMRSFRPGGTIPAAVKTLWNWGRHLPPPPAEHHAFHGGVDDHHRERPVQFRRPARTWIGIITSRERWDTPAPVWMMTAPLFHPGARHRL
jgi:hypothetical protein